MIQRQRIGLFFIIMSIANFETWYLGGLHGRPAPGWYVIAGTGIMLIGGIFLFLINKRGGEK